MQTAYPPQTKLLRPDESGIPVLLGFGSSGHVADWVVTGGRQTIGRVGSGSDIELPSPVVSGHHGELYLDHGYVTYRDVGSTNGTVVNGVPCMAPVQLRDGYVLSIAPRRDPSHPAFKLVFMHLRTTGLTWRRVDLLDGVREVRMGRGEGGLQLADEFVSRQHVSFLPRGRELYVFDLSSTNGVYVDGRRIEGGTLLPPLGIVRFGNTWACYANDALWVGSTAPIATQATPEPTPAQRAWGPMNVPTPPPPKPSGPVLHIDIQQKVVGSRGRQRVLLKDVRADIDNGDFVLVLGGSGAGKSTFLKAVMGYNRAQGSIRYGDVDVYDQYDRIKYDIGYVPQENLVRMDDTVFDTLVSSARLRMRPHLPHAEYERAARKVAQDLGLEAISGNLVGRISGGQLRRVCIGCELVGDPSLLFLDEPDSGLDEPVARGIRRDLRHVADSGKIVMVITHSPDIESELFSKVLVIAKCSDGTGHLLFCGPPADAERFFEVNCLSDIVGRVNTREENGDGRADEFLMKWSTWRG